MIEIRALLLTDVVDSTKLSEALGDAAMAQVWAAHDRAARDLLPQWQGREIDKTDGMLLLFEQATDAVGYALDYHRALAALKVPLTARAGLHVGQVILRENSAEDVARGAKPLEVDGLAKPTAARIMSLARGGQTLLSTEARASLGEQPGGGALRLQSHGHWMVKGVSDPIELFEIGTAETRFESPSDGDKAYRVVRNGEWWLPVREIPNNLQQPATSFIGRERERDEIKTLMASSRLVTLLGMGGLGKTRLSLQVAAELMAQFTDGVWFLDLSPLSDPALVVAEAARVLDVAEEPGRPLLATVSAHLRTKRALLILDNCEHLIKPAADLAHAIVKTAPQVCMIASSREPLHVPGERTYPILPLPVPERNAPLAVLQATPAVQLFVQRAQAHKPQFELNEREAPAVAELVARLEGIPLALELAAARVRSLSVADINKRLNDRYKILTGGSRVLQERQQTLRALVDWSYELLNENEQLLLRRLAVFVGGFNLEAAEKVCGVEPIEDFEVLDLLGSLVEKSLVMLEEREDGSRYRMLETIRDYAAEKLRADGVETAPAAARHCEYFFELAKLARAGMDSPDQATWLQRLETDLDNFRAGMSLALAGGVDPVIAVKYAVAMQGFWIYRGYISEGRRLVDAALQLPAVQAVDVAKAHALYVGAALAESQSDHDRALQMLETCLELRRGLGSLVDVAATLSTLSMARLKVGDSMGAEIGELEALEVFRRLGDRVGEAVGLLHLGEIAHHAGDAQQASAHLALALSIAQDIDYREVEAECELMLGELAFDTGDFSVADERLTRSLDVCRDAADRRGEASALWRLGRVDSALGRVDSARARLGAALRAFRDFEMWEELLGCLEDYAVLGQRIGTPGDAVRIVATVTTFRQRLSLGRSSHAEARWAASVTELRDRLSDVDFVQAWNEAWDQWEVDDAIRCALAMGQSAAAPA